MVYRNHAVLNGAVTLCSLNHGLSGADTVIRLSWLRQTCAACKAEQGQSWNDYSTEHPRTFHGSISLPNQLIGKRPIRRPLDMSEGYAGTPPYAITRRVQTLTHVLAKSVYQGSIFQEAIAQVET